MASSMEPSREGWSQGNEYLLFAISLGPPTRLCPLFLLAKPDQETTKLGNWMKSRSGRMWIWKCRQKISATEYAGKGLLVLVFENWV